MGFCPDAHMGARHEEPTFTLPLRQLLRERCESRLEAPGCWEPAAVSVETDPSERTRTQKREHDVGLFGSGCKCVVYAVCKGVGGAVDVWHLWVMLVCVV